MSHYRIGWSLVALAVVVSTARADVDQDGNIMPTGNAVVDASLVMINAMNAEIKEYNDSNRVLRDREKISKKMDQRLAEMKAQLAKIDDARRDIAQKRHNLVEDKRAALSAAGGDQSKEQEVEAEFAKRSSELEAAEAALREAPKTIPQAMAYYEMMNQTLKSIPNSKDADAYWNGGILENGQRANGLKYTFTKQRSRFEEEWRKATTQLDRASTLIGSKSTLDTQRPQSIGKWEGRVTGVPDKFEFTVNGVKIEKTGQPFAIGEDRKIVIRALIMDARRKQGRELKSKPPANVKLETANDYHIAYHFGAKSSEWHVTKEDYEWRKPATRTGRSETDPELRSSGGKSKNDFAEIVIDPDTVSDQMRVWVRAEITWLKNGSESNDDSAQGELSFSINPPK